MIGKELLEFRMKCILYMSKNRNEEKKKNEKRILEKFLTITPELSEFEISEFERPDFVLSDNNEIIGIEITELISEADAVLYSICRENYDKGLTPKQIESNAHQKHGDKASVYNYWNLNGKSVVGRGLYSLTQTKKKYAKALSNKIIKYHDVKDKYNKFIVLCDATQRIEITEADEAEEVLKDISLPEKQDIYVVILYQDSNNRVHKFVSFL